MKFFHNLSRGPQRRDLLRIRGFVASLICGISLCFQLDAKDENLPLPPDWEKDFVWDDTVDPSRFDPEAHLTENSEIHGVGTEAELLPQVDDEASAVRRGVFPIVPDARFNSIAEFLVGHHSLSEGEAIQVAGEIHELFVLMRREGRRLEQEIPGGDFEADLESGRLKLPLKNDGHMSVAEPRRQASQRAKQIGRAKVTNVHGVKWIRVVHKRVPTAFTFYNIDKVVMDSAHMHLIHANNHFNSGKHIRPEELPEKWMQKARAKGALFGRDELASLYRENVSPEESPTLVESQLFLRPKPGTPQYDYEFKLACDKPFSLPNMFVNGTLMGLAQIGVLVGLNKVSPHIPLLGGHMEPLHPMVLAFTFAYSHYAGGWLYPKLRARSQRLTYGARFWLRGLTISLPYAIVYKLFVTKGQFLEASIEGYEALAVLAASTALNIGINFAINNRVSNELNEHTQLDQELRTQVGYLGDPDNRGGESIVREGWLAKRGIKVKRIDFMGQLRYLVLSFSSRTVDLNNNLRGFSIPLPGLESSYFLSIGKILYLGLAPLLKYTVMKRAERGGSPLAAEHRERWNMSWTGRSINSLKPASLGATCRKVLAKVPFRKRARQRDSDFSEFLF